MNIYVGNLPYSVTEQDLRELFESFGVQLENKIYELQIDALMSDDDIDFPNVKFYCNNNDTTKSMDISVE